MLDIFRSFATDENLENNGTWFPIGGDARVLVARAGNRAYAKALTKAVAEQRLVLDRNDEVADAASDQIMVDVLASTILLGWEGVSFKGGEMAYSTTNAKTVLAIKDFRKLIVGFAEDVDAYKLKEEETAGNV